MKKNLLRLTPFLFAILLLAGLLSFLSCYNKGEEISIQSMVYDPVLKKPLSGVLVSISSKKVSSGIYTNGYQKLASATTDNSGAFSFVVPKEKTESYKFVFAKDQYFENEVILDPELVEKNSFYGGYFELNPQAGIQLRVRNQNPWDNQDQVSWKIMNPGISCYECCNSNMLKGNGNTFDTTHVCKLVGNKNLIIFVSSTKNGTTTIDYDTVWCPVFTTTQHNIFY